MSATTTPAGGDENLAEYAHRLQCALTNLTGGGSENFVRHQDKFRADIPFCLNNIRERESSQHEVILDFVRRAASAEAKCDALRREVERLREVLEFFAKGFFRVHDLRRARAALNPPAQAAETGRE